MWSFNVLLFAASLLTPPLFAQQPSLKERFRKLDTNGDGRLTFEESGQARWFRGADRRGNGDGFVTLDEVGGKPAVEVRTLIPKLGEDLRAWLTKLDADQSRTITRDELDDPREIRGADRNADGEVSYREANRFFEDMQATLAARANPDIYFPWRKTEGQKPLRTAESGDPLLDLTFTRSLRNGEKDAHGNLLTGTEVMHLETHRGMLVATLSGWNHDKKRLPWPGASIAVKKATDAEWEREHNFGEQTGRAGSLASIAFTTDATGATLDEPVSVLLAGVGGRGDAGVITVWAREDESGTWTKTIAGRHDGPGSPEVRVLSSHVDTVTGIHHVFAAASNGMLFRGAYDSEAPGRIRWDVDQPEIAGRERRLMAMAELDGSFYLTVDLEPTEPENGGLFRRIDGPEPKWQRVSGWSWSTPNPDTPRPWFGLRGLTNVHGVLLGAREQPGTMDRIEPKAEGEKVIVDYDVRSGLLDTWPFPPESGGAMCIIAYNDMVPARHPTTNESIALIPLGTRHPEGGRMYRGNTNEVGASAWYLVRYGEGDYGIGQISDPAHPIPNQSSGGLRATRTIRPSPFPEEQGRVWYFGGFDAFGGPSHLHTGWVYRGELPAGKVD